MAEVAEVTPAMWACCLGWLLGTAISSFPRIPGDTAILETMRHAVIELYYRQPQPTLKTAQECETIIQSYWPRDNCDYPTIQQFFQS